MSTLSEYELNMPAEPTMEARRECAEFLVEMLRIGWQNSQLDELERIWWTVRDNRGNVKKGLRHDIVSRQ